MLRELLKEEDRLGKGETTERKVTSCVFDFFFTWSDLTGVFVKPHHSLNSIDEDGSFALSVLLQRPTET